MFNTFELTGHTPPLADVLKYYDTLEPIPISTGNTGPRRDELPLGGDVVTFPTGPERLGKPRKHLGDNGIGGHIDAARRSPGA